ncbi:GntR family transcriptional regulator [Bacillus sp. ISL-47]|uniref:GntR family transcriptional regulator n=1 Tax=Bacillus sp. ISL-47 TaxID=2819130 RepID=UPI001BE873F4|nr:GntR family transcriptional regulator [Bacillus sp. ISL-47]MBT2689840.1 GntR family transcriptional regulator [Bacillus sp. ISL-47]MBT2710217.1 GntR family transcriptional regulator [Pseudomonas sp. ISL-84]
MSFENTTLSQRISEEIAIKISEGALKPGDRLLELELTKEFGTSRAPIREALFILEKDGIVERVPRKGVFVKKRTKKELLDLYEVVYRLLEIALTKLMDSRTDVQLKKIENLIIKMEETLEGNKVKQCFDLLEELQKDFFVFSGNTVLEDLYMRINSQLIPFRYISLSYPTSMEHSIREYSEIMAGLKEKDLTRILETLKRKEKRALTVLEKFVDNQ